jgi:hypothetical protein
MIGTFAGRRAPGSSRKTWHLAKGKAHSAVPVLGIAMLAVLPTRIGMCCQPRADGLHKATSTNRPRKEEAMILILEYEGEGEDSKNKISKDADILKKKLDTQAPGHDERIIRTAEELKAYFGQEASKAEEKIHVMAHGNTREVGNYNAAGLGEFLWKSGLSKRPKIKKITLHTCFSGTESVNPENRSWSPPLVWQLASYFSAKGKDYIVVRGYDGESRTDSQGHGWALKTDANTDVLARPRAGEYARERALMEANSLERDTARPKWAVYAYGAPFRKD